ncbi:MAG: SGNH/GDSL hydrolase family protein [Pirellulaceae bacterium]|nr:SGNH/GDSL hydrolase family protein [Pirellulaceae bacterium]
MLLGLSPFLLAELVCRGLDWGRPLPGDRDPLVGFAGIEPLFVLNAESQRYEIPPHRLAYFSPDSFAAHKSPDEYRVFCLGGSTVQGRPYAKETSFTTWLRLSLEAADPRRQWTVVNCGGVSYASYRLVPILEEVLGHHPDLIVVYTGHNEFLEERTYGRLRPVPRPVSVAFRWLLQSRLLSICVRAGSAAFNSPGSQTDGDRPLLPREVDALLDYQGGLEAYQRDDAWRHSVVEHYEWNLQRIARLCEQARVPLVLVDPVSNLKDCPPFKTVPRAKLPAGDQRQFDHLWRRAVSADAPLEETVSALEQALRIDDRHASAWFKLGKCLEELQRDEAAYSALVRAKDEDVCPLRMLEAQHDRLRSVAAGWSVPLVEVRQRFRAESPQRLVGDEWMADHVHPAIHGHQLIASLLLDEMVRSGRVQPAGQWQTRQQELYRRHLASLDEPYFARGRERLAGLRRWAAGRSNKLRDETPRK